MISYSVEKLKHTPSDRTSAGNKELYAVAENIISDLGKRKARELISDRSCGVRDLQHLFEFFICFFAARLYFPCRFFVYRIPYERYGENMRYLMLFYRVEKCSGIHILQKDEGAREESEPEINGNKSENVIEGEKRQVLQLTLVMISDFGATLNNAYTFTYLIIKALSGVYTQLYVTAGAG